MPAVPPESLIVVTGITGFLGSHVALAALKAGLRVRGTVRSLEKTKDLPAAFEKQGVDITKLEIVEIDDCQNQEKCERIFKDAAGVAHCALPMLAEELVAIAVETNLAVLRAAAKTSSITRVVLCSSSTASVSGGDIKDELVTSDYWNDAAQGRYEAVDPDDVKNKIQFWWTKYDWAKTLSERVAWEWMEANKPSFDLVALLPDMNFGPIIYGPPRATAAFIWRLLHNDSLFVQITTAHWFVDVRDTGKFFSIALTTPSLSGKRCWVASSPFGWNLVIQILRKHFPNAEVAPEVEGERGEVDKQLVDNSAATGLMGGWITLEQSLIDTGKAWGL